MKKIGSYEAKTHLSKILGQIANGESITITKHGVPVAMLVPAQPARKTNPRLVIEKLRMFRKGHTLGGIGLRELIEEGRKF
ncbi:MAG TPA: type II toxin-antitoxin system prevent-host-death family antitoxin [Thermodesulfobacteriota bacterium]|nr:type II toxin-antitoxin system prevent-host-death family antitoxin [Thermodesulfobacteriota bacterium]